MISSAGEVRQGPAGVAGASGYEHNAADAELVRTLYVYDMPLIGVIRRGGSVHLFRCL